ncbi:MAG: hypothetical protein FD181_2186 [Prolixibacteraceae bacterium]|nr:MAG: hypothetical protein FD181_2186 [Prolixibacteraceae bacterium]
MYRLTSPSSLFEKPEMEKAKKKRLLKCIKNVYDAAKENKVESSANAGIAENEFRLNYFTFSLIPVFRISTANGLFESRSFFEIGWGSILVSI